MDATVISDVVNLASRLEGLTKIYGAHIIASEDVFDATEERDRFAHRFLGRVQVKGKKESIGVFEVLESLPEETLQSRIDCQVSFERGTKAYLNLDFEQAVNLFQQVLAEDPADRAARYYLERAEYFLSHEVPPGWAGAEVFDVK